MNGEGTDIAVLSVEQLKALTYDEMVRQQTASNNISILTQEIARREQEALDAALRELESPTEERESESTAL